MGKLVLYLADGSTVDYLLDKECVTIGRRADNDVCLPYPAVSGEHAQVVLRVPDGQPRERAYAHRPAVGDTAPL